MLMSKPSIEDVMAHKFSDDLVKLLRSGKRKQDEGKRLLFTGPSFLEETDSNIPEKSPRLDPDRQKMVTMRGELSLLQYRLQQEEISKRRSSVFHEEEMNSLAAQNQRLENESIEYKSKLKNCLSSINDIQEQLNMCQRELTEAQNGADDKLFKLAKANIERETFLMEKIDALEAELRETKGELLKETLQLSEAKEKVSDLEHQLETKSSEVNEYKSFVSQKEKQLKEMSSLQQKIQTLEDEIAKNKDADALVKAMKSKLDKFPRLEKENNQLVEENKKLREREANIYLLQDENRSLRRKVDLIAQTQADLATAETTIEKLRNQLRAWEQCGDIESRDNAGGKRCSVFRSPEELHRHLRELQRDNLYINECRGRLQSSVADLEARLAEQKRELAKCSRNYRDSDERCQTLEVEIRRVNQRFKLISQERDFAKQLIDEYEQDATTGLGKDEKARIDAMESLLKNYRVQMAEQDHTIQMLRQIEKRKSLQQSADKSSVVEKSSSDSIAVQSSEKLMADLRQRLAELEEKLAQVTMEKEVLEDRIEKRNLQGDYDPTKTKVLHMEINPASERARKRAEELDQLTKENERLMKRIRALEVAAAAGGSGKVLPDVESETHSTDRTEVLMAQKEVEELKSKLNSESRKSERLIEVFKERSQQMREACFHLLGHKLDIKPSGEVKLTSALADSPEEFLIFRAEEQTASDASTSGSSPSRRWMLLETPHSLTLRKDIEHYIKTYNSIPALVCSVFLENFGRQTMIE